MNLNVLFLKLGFLFLFSIGMPSISAKENKKNKPNFTVESLNFIDSDLTISGGNLVFSDDAKLRIESKLNFLDDKIPDSLKIKVELVGVDGNNKAYTNTVSYWYYPKSSKNGTEISIKATPKSQIKISSVAHFVDDWQGETAYLKIDGKETNFAILLNGIQKPNGNGKCQYGKCFCFGGADCRDGKLIALNPIKLTQTLVKDEKEKATYLNISLNISNASQSKDDPNMLQLLAWGEVTGTVTVELENAKYNGRKTSHLVFQDRDGEGMISLNRLKVEDGNTIVKAVYLHILATEGSSFRIPNANLALTYSSGYEKPTSNNFTWTESWSINQNLDMCLDIKQNHVFMNETNSAKYKGIVIGLNNTKKDKTSPLVAVLETIEASGSKMEVNGHIVWAISNDKKETNIVPIKKDKNGTWILMDSMAIKDSKNPPVLESFQIHAITLCNDTLVFNSLLKEKLDDKKPWDYKIKMSAEASDNPLFQGPNNGSTNILALTIPSSSINISGGNLEIKDNSQLNMLLSNSPNGGFNTTNISSATISMQLEEKGDGKVFYHWGSTVSTSNPKINTNFDTAKYGALTIRSIEIRIVNLEKDTIIYLFNPSIDEGKYGLDLSGNNYVIILKKTEKIKYYDPCNTKFNVKNVSYQETHVSGLYALQLNFKLTNNSDVPNAVAMIVEIKDCNGNSTYVSVSLTYNSSTGFYSGGFTLSETNRCEYAFHYGEIAAYNVCKDKTVWSFSASNAKGNGLGTKNSSSKASTKPQLL